MGVSKLNIMQAATEYIGEKNSVEQLLNLHNSLDTQIKTHTVKKPFRHHYNMLRFLHDLLRIQVL